MVSFALLNDRNIDFMKVRMPALYLSIFMVVASLVLIAVRGLNLGIDFTGGTLVEVGYQEPAHLEDIRSTLTAAGYDRMVVQHFGTSQDVLIRLAPQASTEGDLSTAANEIVRILNEKSDKPIEMRRIEFVGPQIGEELREDGGLAMLFALGGILIYVAMRFEYRFSLGAIFALVHDVIITVGFFALTRIEFDLTVLAAVLAVIGYSLNDTIVVFDRIRENFRSVRKEDTQGILNLSINQTLSRTLMTSFTTILVLIALNLFGGSVINSFSVALIVGIVIGTYSSIYVASNAALMMGVDRTDLIPVEVSKDDLEKMP